MRSRRRTHHSHVAWSGSDEEFQSQTPQPAWDAAWDRVRAERKQAGLPNTYTVADRTPSGDIASGTTATGIPTYVGPRGEVYHYSMSGKKVYERRRR
jgi:hypothetical protein